MFTFFVAFRITCVGYEESHSLKSRFLFVHWVIPSWSGDYYFFFVTKKEPNPRRGKPVDPINRVGFHGTAVLIGLPRNQSSSPRPDNIDHRHSPTRPFCRLGLFVDVSLFDRRTCYRRVIFDSTEVNRVFFLASPVRTPSDWVEDATPQWLGAGRKRIYFLGAAIYGVDKEEPESIHDEGPTALISFFFLAFHSLSLSLSLVLSRPFIIRL